MRDKKKMSSLTFFYFITTLLLFMSLRPSAADTKDKGTCNSVAGVEQTCKSIAKQDPSIDVNFCIGSLSTDSRTASADLRTLAVTAGKLAIAYVASSEMKIEDLMELENDGTEKAVLERCLEAYRAALDKLQDAVDNLSSGMEDAAVALMGRAEGAAEACQAAFATAKKGSAPLSREDKDYVRLARIAGAIAKAVE